MNIEDVSNGYLVTLPAIALADERFVYKTIEEVLDAVLAHFSPFTNYGKISLLKELMELSRRANGEKCDRNCGSYHPCKECKARSAIMEMSYIAYEALK